MARFLADENFPLPVVDELRRLGHDVLTINEAGLSNQQFPDAEVLKFATSNGRTLLTLNRKHFVRLHSASADHSGIIACTVDLDSAALATRIHEAVQSRAALNRRIIRINRPV